MNTSNYFVRLLPNGRVFIRNIGTNETSNLEDVTKLAKWLETDADTNEREKSDEV